MQVWWYNYTALVLHSWILGNWLKGAVRRSCCLSVVYGWRAGECVHSSPCVPAAVNVSCPSSPRSPTPALPPPPQLHFIWQPTQRFVLLVEDTAVMNVQVRIMAIKSVMTFLRPLTPSSIGFLRRRSLPDDLMRNRGRKRHPRKWEILLIPPKRATEGSTDRNKSMSLNEHHTLFETGHGLDTMQSFHFSFRRNLLSLSFSSRPIISLGGSWSWAPQVLLWLKTLLTVIRRPGAHHSRLFILARCQIYHSVSPMAWRSCFSHTWENRKWGTRAVHVITYRMRLLQMIFFFFVLSIHVIIFVCLYNFR